MMWHVGLIILGLAMILMGSVNVYDGVTRLLHGDDLSPDVKVKMVRHDRTSSWVNR